MQRCLELARLGIPWAYPNPLVGAVLVYENRIIGEGYHARFGEGHAEVNCLASVNENDKPLIAKATLYVSLEPCSHTGKTPPCADLILRNNIPHVVVASTDPSAKVNGRGIAKLREAGVLVETGILNQEARTLNPGFFTYHEKQRPHITLKWAESADGYLGRKGIRTPLSGPETQSLVHDWRRQHQAIWVGLNTVLIDNPELTNRLHPGPSPLRITYDYNLQCIEDAHYFNDKVPTLIFTNTLNGKHHNKEFIAIGKTNPIPTIIKHLYNAGIQSVLVEGGAQLLNALIEADCYDTIYRIKTSLALNEPGVPAPQLPPKLRLLETIDLNQDIIEHYQPQ